MFYLVCFLFSFITLLFLVYNSRGMDVNVIALAVICVIGNGGYFALYRSRNLEEALLANILTYSIGCFVPMIMFLLISNICRVKISNIVQTILYFIQSLLFMSVCGSGVSDLFYKSVEFHNGKHGSYLSKTYGPIHDLYIVIFCFYIMACIAIVGSSVRRKTCRVSISKAQALLSLFIVSTILYFAERFAKLTFEIEPFVFTITSFWVILIFIEISRYSAYDNLAILESKKNEIAYIVFNKKLCFMSCNDYALELFPELADWEIEKMIPGNGGRFNTFLRIPFRSFVNEEVEGDYISGYEYKNKYYRTEIKKLIDNQEKFRGYVIKVELDVVKTKALEV